MDRFLPLAFGAILGACNADGSYEDGFEDGLEVGQGGGSTDGDVNEGTEDSHAELCEVLLEEAERAYEEGYTANVTVDADPNELSSGYNEDGSVWMQEGWDTDDGNDQVHVPCTSLRMDDGEWMVAGEADSVQSGSDLEVFVRFSEDDFRDASVVDLQWVVMTDSGPLFATTMNGDVDTLYLAHPGDSQPISY